MDKQTKQVASFRFDKRVVELNADLARFLDVPKARVVEDALAMVAQTLSIGARAHNAMWEEVHRRYGGDAQVTIKVVLDDDGKEKGRILIDGKEPEDVTAELVIEPTAGNVHLFLNVVGWYPDEYGTVRVGPTVLLTQPLIAAAKLPYPVDPTLGLVATLDELVTQSKVGTAVHEPVEA